MPQTALIRIALLVGVLTFGGVAYFSKGAVATPPTPALLSQLVWIARGLWVAALAGTAVMFMMYQRAESPTRRTSLSIIAWAFGESVALLGGVVWMLTGSPVWYAPGLIFLVATFIVFPARART